MNIALLAPSAVPYTKGGLEYLVEGIYGAIKSTTKHNIEIFQLPVVEIDFWSLMHAYEAFFNLNLDHFDMCVSFKYPTWMTTHHNHVLYMAHPLRGVYDTYHLFGMPEHVGSVSDETGELLQISNQLHSRESVKLFFETVRKLEQHQSKRVRKDLTFPGPVSRKLVRALDQWAFLQIRRFGAISKTVAKREGYFPTTSDVEVTYPPGSSRGVPRESDDGYLLSVSRLDGAKRIDLVISAMKKAEGGRLLIAGDGPERSKLESLASGDSRIVFLGRVSDEEVVNLYSNCRAVVYVPYEEDYGLTTLEAYSFGKPVIACVDSGGVLEFVRNRETGLVASPTPDSLAALFQYAFQNKDHMRHMGMRGCISTQDITWSNVINWIVGEKSEAAKSMNPTQATKEQRIVVLSTFPIYPPRNGGQLRSFYLYKSLASLGKVAVISLAPDGSTLSVDINDRVKEIRVARSERHIQEEARLEATVGVPITDIVASKLMRFTPDFARHLERELMDATTVILCHPFLVDLIPEARNFKVILDSQDVEQALKAEILPYNASGKNLLQEVRRMEKRAIDIADKVIVCTDSDKRKLHQLYRCEDKDFIIVPNGVDTKVISYISSEKRENFRQEIGVPDEGFCLFIGSWHQPNIVAVKRLYEIAALLPDVHFIVAGSVGMAIGNDSKPENVALVPELDEPLKRTLLSTAAVAVHPMEQGSGTNLKIFEYMSSGLPIVSTPHGMRGVPDDILRFVYLAETPSDFARQITSALDTKNSEAVRKCREFVENEMDWSKLSSLVVEGVP